MAKARAKLRSMQVFLRLSGDFLTKQQAWTNQPGRVFADVKRLVWGTKVFVHWEQLRYVRVVKRTLWQRQYVSLFHPLLAVGLPEGLPQRNFWPSRRCLAPARRPNPGLA